MEEPRGGDPRRPFAPHDQPGSVTTWTVVDGAAVRAVEYRPQGPSRGLVCLLPGLSLTDYVAPTARALAARGLHCAVLDLPGLARPAAVRLLRHAGRTASIIRSAMHLRPEDLIPDVTAPLVLTAGEADTMAPQHWLEHLRGRATASPHTRVAVLPGSHNNLFTHPWEVADLVVAGLAPGRVRRDA